MKQLLFILSVFFISCSQQPTVPVRFEFVDFTLFHHFTTTSVYIDSSKHITLCTACCRNKNKFYQGILSNDEQNKLDSLLRIIFRSQQDTSVGTPIPDGTAYRVVFRNKDKNIRVTSWGDTCCEAVNMLVFSIAGKVETFKTPFTDTNFVFPSRDFIPKPIKEPTGSDSENEP